MARWLWTQKQDVGPPRAGGMVYDSSRKGAMFLFNRTTWDWDGETWVELDDMGPAGSVALIYDALRNRAISFGSKDNKAGETLGTVRSGCNWPIPDRVREVIRRWCTTAYGTVLFFLAAKVL